MSQSHSHPDQDFALGAPLSPLPSPSQRPESFGPLSQYHFPSAGAVPDAYRIPARPRGSESTLSPVETSYPDSPTLGTFSPVSMLSPKNPPLSLSPEPLRFKRTAAGAGFASPWAAAAAAVPVQGIMPRTPAPRAAHDGGVHIRDQKPSLVKRASTILRFPARKPAPVSRAPARDGVEAGAEAGSTRPITLYLADLNPHLVAAAPTAPIARSRYYNGVSFYEGRLDEDEGAGCEGLEMREVELREPAPRAGSRAYLAGSDAQSVTVSGDGDGRDVEGQGGMRTKGEEVRARNRNCLIGWVFILALVIAIVVFAVFIYLANRPRGVAG